MISKLTFHTITMKTLSIMTKVAQVNSIECVFRTKVYTLTMHIRISLLKRFNASMHRLTHLKARLFNMHSFVATGELHKLVKLALWLHAFVKCISWLYCMLQSSLTCGEKVAYSAYTTTSVKCSTVQCSDHEKQEKCWSLVLWTTHCVKYVYYYYTKLFYCRKLNVCWRQSSLISWLHLVVWTFKAARIMNEWMNEWKIYIAQHEIKLK